MGRTSLVVLCAIGVLGCGGSGTSGDTTGNTTTPTVHSIDSSNQRVAVNTSKAIGPFSLPAGATVTYTITDMPTGIGNDTMNFVIVSDAMVQGQSAQLSGYGVQTGVSSTHIVTPQLPADSYDLVVQCTNLVDDCLFGDVMTAFY